MSLAKERVAERRELIAGDAEQVALDVLKPVVLDHHQVAVTKLNPSIALRHPRPRRRAVGADMVSNCGRLIDPAPTEDLSPPGDVDVGRPFLKRFVEGF